jgi:hypothetical protein
MAHSEPLKNDVPLANPAPLGLMGFGITTVLLNLSNAGFFNVDTIILAMGLFYGGIAQIIAGAMEFRKGNTFGMTAFLSYGLFWESFAFLLMLPHLGLGSFPISNASLQAYLVMWGVFTLLMFVGTLRKDGALMVVFGTLFILFFLLAAGVTNASVHTFAGYEGIVCGLSAMYAAIAQLLNELYGRTILPLFARRTS